jgi:hypothetical protein
MEQGDFESLVSRMEQLAREKPKLYRRRVFLLGALGYAYLASGLGARDGSFVPWAHSGIELDLPHADYLGSTRSHL